VLPKKDAAAATFRPNCIGGHRRPLAMAENQILIDLDLLDPLH
jgi:hypothetical protein